ncbi:TPA: hypothetical protein ACJETU_001040 [Acinetobacter baumannii]|uniref:Uncharacterized protein n=1 Tax=Acinetobacter baumannii TaxID=470 RepID=A0A6B2Q793_ACIBA|nr:hypothetical protein [Acinetobacter baumannii]CAH1073635.1 Uncharacterised protein [Acinetobacter phage MD-2021a]KAF0626487.1 hypothetical protein AB71198_03148 [Acinetobacter baumannii]MBD0176367.1 hypothetical protein [Acinetobacter baumannii]MBF6871041.1 hypothetical protein [Acinetobacter baumannii]MBF8415017.1 hypothetical protein [Acinetobacter baumannii]
MKPEQFIREFGVEKAREVVEGAPSSATTARPSLDFKHYLYGRCENAGGSHILLSDLKRLVESLDLVVFLGGIDGLNVLLDMANSPFALSGVTRDGVFYSSEKIKEIVAVHESIYGGGE